MRTFREPLTVTRVGGATRAAPDCRSPTVTAARLSGVALITLDRRRRIRVPLTAVGPDDFQTVTVKAPDGDRLWYSYVSIADNTTSDSLVHFDAVTENQLTQR